MNTDFLLRLQNTLLFKHLLSLENLSNSGNLLSTKVLDIVTYVSPLLERIPEHMPQYTLHDPNHSAKVVELAAKIIPFEVLNNLNSIEISILILSGYLHDIGMTASQEEKEEIIKKSSDFDILFKSDLDKFSNYENYKKANEHRLATFIEDQVFTEYLRRNHVKRSAKFIEDNLKSGKYELSINEIPFWKHLISVCNGHGEPVTSLKDTSKWARETLVGEQIINVQYLSLVLRLADILDLDPERTPKIIYEFVNPQDPTSIVEWKKHRSIIGHSITSNKILFEAETSSPEVERALKQFIDWIELERKETLQLLNSYSDTISTKYFLQLNEEITKNRIKSDGSYISNDLKFEIDYKRVIDLLMGQRLYKSPAVALRELLQNSVDAIKIREYVYTNKLESFKPLIEIKLDSQNLVIKDNGIGMDEEIFKKYFLQVGKSFSSSQIFYANFSSTDITSEFGIGVLSVFMIADSVTIESRKEPSNPLSPPMPILFEIPTAYSYTTQRKTSKADIGTIITIKLKSGHPFSKKSLLSILEEIIPITPYEIKCHEVDDYFVYKGLSESSFDLFPNNISDENIEKYETDAFLRKPAPRTYSAVEVNFNHIPDSTYKGLKGKINLINNQAVNWRQSVKGYIAQRNFRIGQPTSNKSDIFSIKTKDNIENLLPMWVSCHCEINLTNDSCLSVFPDRTDVLIDDKYTKLKNVLEARIIEQLRNFLNLPNEYNELNSFIRRFYSLLAAGFIGADNNRTDEHISATARTFFDQYLFLPVVNKTGLKWLSLREVLDYQYIGIMYYRWDISYESKIVELFNGFNAAIIITSQVPYKYGHSIETLLNFILGKASYQLRTSKIITGGLPKFPIKIIDTNDTTPTYNREHVPGIAPTLSGNFNEILFIIGEALGPYAIFNTQHPLINVLLNEEGLFKNEEAEHLLESMSNKVGDFMAKSYEELAKLDTNYSITYFKSSNSGRPNFNILSIGIITKYPDFLPKINTLFIDYWSSVNTMNFSSQIMPNLVKSNFLDFWS